MTAEVYQKNEEYETTKMENRDIAVSIEAARIDIKKIDREIFEIQQEIKIKQVELAKLSGAELEEETEVTALNETMEDAPVKVSDDLLNDLNPDLGESMDESFDRRFSNGKWRQTINKHDNPRRDTYGTVDD